LLVAAAAAAVATLYLSCMCLRVSRVELYFLLKKLHLSIKGGALIYNLVSMFLLLQHNPMKFMHAGQIEEMWSYCSSFFLIMSNELA
jgi:hypothetical protein